MNEYEVISDSPYRCGECPMWDAEQQLFLWSDMLAGELYSYEPQTKAVKLLTAGKNVSGFTLKRGGGLVCATHQGLYIWEESYGWTLVADEYEGQSLHSNDATADPEGRFIFGTTFYDQTVGDNFERGRLYSVDKNAGITVIAEGLGLSNGLGFSPDKATLYLTDTYTREIVAFDYDVKSGRTANKRPFVNVPDTEGIPDGLTVDSEGFVWSAQWYGGCVVRYDPDGKPERRINVPSGQTSSVIFGGADLTDLYVTTAAEVVRLSAAPKGYDFDAPHNGSVYRFHTEIQGLEEHSADIDIRR